MCVTCCWRMEADLPPFPSSLTACAAACHLADTLLSPPAHSKVVSPGMRFSLSLEVTSCYCAGLEARWEVQTAAQPSEGVLKKPRPGQHSAQSRTASRELRQTWPCRWAWRLDLGAAAGPREQGALYTAVGSQPLPRSHKHTFCARHCPPSPTSLAALGILLRLISSTVRSGDPLGPP